MLTTIQTLVDLGLTTAEIDAFVVDGWTLQQIYEYVHDEFYVQDWDEYDEYLAELDNAYP